MERLFQAVDQVLKAFGAPGDWGYGTTMGGSLLELHRARAEARTIARVLREAAEGWVKITCADDLPKKPGKDRYEYVECLIIHKGEIKMRPWNCEHLCWDDEEHDDFYCDAMEPSYYMRIPSPPSENGNDR